MQQSPSWVTTFQVWAGKLSTAAMFSAGTVGAGLALPSSVTRLRETCRALRKLRSLRLLRQALGTTAPDLPGSGTTLVDLEAEVYRMRIEILDGFRVLRPWCDPVLAVTARGRAATAGVPKVDEDAYVDAVVLHEALRRHSREQATVPDAVTLTWQRTPAEDEERHLRSIARYWNAT